MQLDQASGRFTNITQEIKGLLGQIRAEVDASRAHFKGNAAASFQSVMTNYDADAAKLNQALATLAEGIASTGKSFHTSDEASQAALKSAGSGLNAS